VLGYVASAFSRHYSATAPSRRVSRGASHSERVAHVAGRGTLSASFIPVYAALNEKNKDAARALAGGSWDCCCSPAGVLAVIG